MAQPQKKVVQRHLLVVDDDRLVLAALTEGLRAAGYRVTAAPRGEDGLAHALRDAPDLALLDMRMPGMSGIELAGKLRELGISSLFLSAYGDQETVRAAAQEGALGYLVKPLDMQQITPSIETALVRAQEIRRLHEEGRQLSAALAGSREISMAIGILMMRDRLGREEAFNVLRANARSQRRTVADLAGELLGSTEKFHTIK